MNFNRKRVDQANAVANSMKRWIRENRWKDVMVLVEQWPELLFWDSLEANCEVSLFLQIWEEDRWRGRECVRILLKTPELMKKVPIKNYGYSTFQVEYQTCWIFGSLTGFLAGAGEKELMEEALNAGLDPDGWNDGGWYEGTDGMYFFDQMIGGTIHKAVMRSSGDDFTRNTSPILIAIFREDVEMVKLLMKYGATFSFQGELCQEYLKDLSSWTIRDLLMEAYGGENHDRIL